MGNFGRRDWKRAQAHGVNVQAVMTDKGSVYISPLHAIACRALGIRHIRTRPRRPCTNGKAERFIRTMLREWAYGAIYASFPDRTAALSGWLERYTPEDHTAASATSPRSADPPAPTYSGPTPKAPACG